VKKALCILLAVVLGSALVGCGGGTATTSSPPVAPSESTTAPVTSPPSASSGTWGIKFYIDEFQQPTSDKYISTKDLVRGTFSNSATTNSALSILFIIDADSLAIALNEYGSSRVKNSSSSNYVTYNITLLTVDKNKLNVKGTMRPGSDRINISGEDKDAVISALSKQGGVSFYIVQSDRTTTTYLFSVETDNFAEEYQSLTS